MVEESTFEREITPLRAINDHHPKTILTLDNFTIGNYDGIKAPRKPYVFGGPFSVGYSDEKQIY